MVQIAYDMLMDLIIGFIAMFVLFPWQIYTIVILLEISLVRITFGYDLFRSAKAVCAMDVIALSLGAIFIPVNLFDNTGWSLHLGIAFKSFIFTYVHVYEWIFFFLAAVITNTVLKAIVFSVFFVGDDDGFVHLILCIGFINLLCMGFFQAGIWAYENFAFWYTYCRF